MQSSKKTIILLIAIALSVVFLPSVFSKLFLYKIPVYVMDDACAGKQMIASIDFSNYNSISEVPNQDWIIYYNPKTGKGEIKDGALRLSDGSLRLNTSTHKMPINVTVAVIAKVNKSEDYLDYLGYSEIDIKFYQNMGDGRVLLPGAFIFSRSGSGTSKWISVRDAIYSYRTSQHDSFNIREEMTHYQGKVIAVNREEFNYYSINRTLEDNNFIKSFYVNGNLVTVLNLTKAYNEDTNSKFNLNDNFVIGVYPYQAVYIKKVEICE